MLSSPLANDLDWIDKMAQTALKRVEGGYYQISKRTEQSASSFVKAIQNGSSNSIVAEIKPGSPSGGSLLHKGFKVENWAESFKEAGATGLSVLTEPEHFRGSLTNLASVARFELPTLMKDFVVDMVQIQACSSIGGSAALLIQSLFDRGYAKFDLDRGIENAHQMGLEVLLEVASLEEYKKAMQTRADMIGINNRDLKSLEVDLNRTRDILKDLKKDRIVWSMSGISNHEDIRLLKRSGVDAFLVGTSLMKAPNPGAKLKELKEA